MAGFTPERRTADRDAEWTGAERRGLRGREASREPAGGAPGAHSVAAGGLADMIDPTAEEAYWRENYETQPYYERGYTYDDYHPAYRTGWEGRARYESRGFGDVERELQADYERNRGASRLGWDRIRHAARAAWERFDATDDFERSQ